MAEKAKAVYTTGIPGSEHETPSPDKDAVEKKRAAYDASVVATGTEAAKKRGGITTAVFKLNAPDMPRRAVPARSAMNPKPSPSPF